MESIRRHTKKALIGIVGGLVVLIGLILVPYPGPGWLIVFGGLAILSTEFAFAKKALHTLKEKYDAWSKWLKRQHVLLQLSVLALTGLVVATTVWLLNGFGYLSGWLGIDIPWLVSPFFR